MKVQTPVEVFNRELERLVRGGVVIEDDLTPDDQRALEVAQNPSGMRIGLRVSIVTSGPWMVGCWRAH
jgi:hypothetical protein